MTRKAEDRLRLDPAKLRKVQRLLGAKTASEAVDRAFDEILKNALLDRRHQKLVESGIEVEDVFGRSVP